MWRNVTEAALPSGEKVTVSVRLNNRDESNVSEICDGGAKV